MSDRVSHVILLCEDDVQEQYVRSYMKTCGLSTDLRARNASREIHGGNVGWVLREFPKELEICRKRAAKARTLLIVVVDADDFEVFERQRHLEANPLVVDGDPLVELIPRRHIETWVRDAAGEGVNETDDYKNPKPAKEEIRAAAKVVHGWVHSQDAAVVCVPSLRSSFSEWRKIG